METTITLDNGLTLICEPMPQANTLAVGFWVRCGSMHESAELGGISHFTEHLVFKATSTKTSEDIARRIDALGGEVDAFTTKEHTCFYARVLGSHAVKAIELLADLVTNPLFRAEDVEMERGVVEEEIDMVEDTPDDLVHETFVAGMWPDHPLGRPILGTRETLARITPERLQEHFARFYHPGNLVVAAAGQVDPAALAKRLEKVFAKAGARRPAAEEDFLPPVGRPWLDRRIKPELEQAHLCLGAQGLSQRDERRYAAFLLDTVLGGGMSSRLVQEIREKRGLAYSIYSSVGTFRQGGYQYVYAAVNPRNAAKVVQQIVRELRKLRTAGITRTELVRAKENMRGGLVLDLEGTTARMSSLAQHHLCFGEPSDLNEALERIARVTLDDVNALAAEMFSPETLSLTLLGDVEKVDLSLDALREGLLEGGRRGTAEGTLLPFPVTAAAVAAAAARPPIPAGALAGPGASPELAPALASAPEE